MTIATVLPNPTSAATKAEETIDRRMGKSGCVRRERPYSLNDKRLR